ALQAIPRTYLKVCLCLNSENPLPQIPGIRTIPRPNYVLSLEPVYEELYAAFSKSLRKRIRRASELHTLDKTPCTPSELITWNQRQQGDKFRLPARAYAGLQFAMEAALTNNRGFIWGARDHTGALRVAGFFLC